jgi:type II secretory pathway component PulC
MPGFLLAIGLAVLPQAPATSADAVVLDGVIVAANPADSVALIRRAGGSRAQVVRIGQEVEGYLLLEVGRGFARLQGLRTELRLQLGAPAALGSLPVSAMERGGDDWVRRPISPEIPALLSGADFAPKVEGGEVRGLRVARLPDGTAPSESDLLPEDVLVSINGEPLVAVDALREIIARLGDREELRIVVRRRGKVLKLAYSFAQ